MTSKVFKINGIYEQVRNDYIRDTEKRLEARLTHEAEEQARKEAKEKAKIEAEERGRLEAEEKFVAEAEANAKADAEEADRIAAEEIAKTSELALTQSESSTSDIVALLLKNLEEHQKEQQLVRARLDQQDLVNSSIQSLLGQLL